MRLQPNNNGYKENYHHVEVATVEDGNSFEEARLIADGWTVLCASHIFINSYPNTKTVWFSEH